MMRSSLLDLGLRSCSLVHPPRILVCGDADFAYTTALEANLRHLQPAARICASAYEPEAELLTRYPHAAGAISSLEGVGVSVQCGVDARDLPSHYGGAPAFDRIVFNLPQSPPAPKARNQIQRHRALLRDFCRSAACALAPRGELWVTLLAGQGGTPIDPISRPWGDTWQIQQQAASAGLLVREVWPADVDALEAAGYFGTGRRKEGMALGTKRRSKGMIVHVLAREPAWAAAIVGGAGGARASDGRTQLPACEVSTVAKPGDEHDDDGRAEPYEPGADTTSRAAEPESVGVAALEPESVGVAPLEPESVGVAPLEPESVGVAPLEWVLDNSFWLPSATPTAAPSEGKRVAAEEPSVQWILQVARQAIGGRGSHVIAAEPKLLDAYERPEDGRKARTYRFVYKSDRIALSRERAIRLNAEVCREIERELLMEGRTPQALMQAMSDDASPSGSADGDGTSEARS